MRLLFIGDVVGRAGRKALVQHLPRLRRRWSLDFVIVNGENAAGGFGITEAICEEFLEAGADCVTTGNHAFDQREALVFIERQPRLLRPVNYPPGTPGRGANLYAAADGRQILVINVQGRLYMDALDDPFAAIEREVGACPLGVGCDALVVDIHAETSSEKMAMGHFVDGRASLVVGTHTHVPTADCQIMPHGVGYMTDAGMTGDYDSVIGMEKEEPLRRFTRKTPGGRLEPAQGEATLCGVAVEIDARGLARKIAPVRVGGRLAQAAPDFWDGEVNSDRAYGGAMSPAK
ncbi:MAG: metallophosphoesterase [Methylocystaceae bacterium]|nr:MAG: metallophosphoesterase [Methylocystaceae bacterium]